MNPRRADAGEMAKVAAFSVAVAGYVYLLGWLVTWVRLSAARIPVDVSLPVIDEKVVFTTGLRTVLLMAVVFGAMCAVAYGAHAWTWNKRAPEWHEVVRSGRATARKLNPPGRVKLKLSRPRLRALKPEGSPANLHEDAIGDPFVRVLAGFNVVVLGAALGLAGARIVQPLIDQLDPGRWWALLLPWAILSTLATWVFTLVGPLRGGRGVHAVLWGLVVTVALLSSAPLGLLILTWAGVATLGRVFGRRHTRPSSKLAFVLSPMPWILLTIYALVALAYYAVPPVSFQHAVITTTSGTLNGGYLARTGAAVYFVTCTPLADATSADEAVSVVPASEVKRVVSGGAVFSVDSGRPPSLPTLALHAFGIDASTPTWIHPALRATRATCAGSQLAPPSVGYQAPQLGEGVIAGAAPPNGRANDGEPPIEQTTPAIAQLARRFQPTILVTVADRFWPVSVGAVLADLGSNGNPTCLHLHGAARKCPASPPQLTDLQPQASHPDDFLRYPSSLDPNPVGQFKAFVRGQQGRQAGVPALHRWLADPGLLDPWRSAQAYFYYAGPADPSRWPASNRDIPPGDIALQYWFFYPYNYYPTATTPDLMNAAPLAADVVNTDLHQGDWEHVTVLLDPKTLAPQWLYLARHSHEGQYLPWNSASLSFDQGHPVIQAAFGGHPSYDAHCGARLRFIPPLNGAVSDWVVCGSGRFAFRASTTPLVDIARTPWGCWKGHFGVATPTEVGNANKDEGTLRRAFDANYLVAGPRSPLWQAENGRLSADGASEDTGFCAKDANPAAPELAAIRAGLGRAGHGATARGTPP